MKKIILATTFFVLIQNISFSQTYTVVYEKEQKINLKGQLNQIKDPALKKKLESRSVVTSYELLHKNGASNFIKKEENENKKDEALELEGAQTKANVNVVTLGNSSKTSILYKDLANNIFLKSSNLMSKEFLVKDTLATYNWKKTKETKTIGNYVCQKATANQDGKEITAWYTPSIPIKDGPDEYYGLPGLIIQLTEGDTEYNALSVQETPDISITKPSQGKKITKAEYQKLRQDRMEAIKQQFKN